MKPGKSKRRVEGEAKPLLGMAPLFLVCPELADRESAAINLGEAVRSVPRGEYGFVEYYCAKERCDCRRVFFQVWAKDQPGKVWASLNFGWESEAFYLKNLGSIEYAREVRAGALDPLNPQSERAEDLLWLFREMLVPNREFVARLERHYRMFKEAIKKGGRK